MFKVLSLALLLCSFNAFAEPTLFKVIPETDHSSVEFVSDAPLEKVVGKTRTVMGFVEFDPGSTGSGARGEIHVDLASLSTGVKLRDRHMRDNHLETDTYPEAVFTLASLALPAGGLPENTRTSVQVSGTLSLHGVERRISPTVFLTRTADGESDALRIEAEFTVLLEHYKIERPKFLLLKLSEEQLVTVDVIARPSNSGMLVPANSVP